jgi:hypothetical protein
MQNQATMNAPGRAARFFDLPTLREIVSAFPATAADQLLDKFAGELPLHIGAIEQASAKADLKALRCRVHTVRGTSLTFGCTGLAVLCDSLKARSERGDVEGCRWLTMLLAQAQDSALSELAALRSPGGPLQA